MIQVEREGVNMKQLLNWDRSKDKKMKTKKSQPKDGSRKEKNGLIK